tara:strand:- start:256742 stop:257653 length:912 start_codon:yes stop_codon:yes gene_type:complete
MLALDIQNLTKTYKNGFQALKNVDLTVEEGDFFSLLGPNGAGKSTLIGIVTSLVNKSSGTVKVFGEDIDKNFMAAKSHIGVVPQEVNTSIFEKALPILMNSAGFYGVKRRVAKQRAEQYLKQLDLWDKRDVQVRMLSGGMKRRLMIARALMHEPKLLILDEPTAGVDIEIRRSMWEFLVDINKQGTTIILTTHYLEEAENLCRNVAMINHGEIQHHGPMAEFLSQLSIETFVLYLDKALDKDPDLGEYEVHRVDDKTLEVCVEANEDMNELFQRLSAQGITVSSMKNKTNRLEELFMRLTQKH